MTKAKFDFLPTFIAAGTCTSGGTNEISSSSGSLHLDDCNIKCHETTDCKKFSYDGFRCKLFKNECYPSDHVALAKTVLFFKSSVKSTSYLKLTLSNPTYSYNPSDPLAQFIDYF